MAPFYVRTRKAIQRIIETTRQRAYEPPRHPWMFEQIPPEIIAGGVALPNPRKQAVIFVVHGMGTQHFAQTAVTLRDGIEDTIDALLRNNPEADIPPPYTAEGFWANYEEIESHFENEWKTFSEKEKEFFQQLWKSRTQSVLRTYFWFLRQLFRLCIDRKIRKTVRFGRWISYVAMLPTGILAFSVLLLRYPRVLSHTLSDVRLYASPRGFIEENIVQRIDRRVGEQFLQLLGLDWDFKPLSPEKQLTIGGKPSVFKYVTWVAHSLGTVVSYNVISDLLTRCEEFKRQGKQLEAVKSVETALHRFITIGSPLEKFALLFPRALRSWPAQYAEEFLRRGHRRWWTNFFHILDPVSGVLRAELFEPYVENFHSRIPAVPLLAHTAYWHDVPILTYVLSRLYGRDVVEAYPTFKTPGQVGVLRLITSVASLAFFVGVIWGLVFLVGHPEVLGKGYQMLKSIL